MMKYKALERMICGVCGTRIFNIKYPVCNHDVPMLNIDGQMTIVDKGKEP